MNENDKQGAAWPCKIIESDFEQDTITVQMQNKDYFVSGGTFWLSMYKQAEPVAWAEEIIDDLQGQFDTDGITHEDSGDALIYLSQAISSVQDAAKRHPAQPVQPAGAQEPVGEVVEEKMAPWCPPHASVKWFQTDFEIGTKFYTEAPAAEPAPLVRLTDGQVDKIFADWNVAHTRGEANYEDFANAIMDAMERVNGGANATD